MTQPLLDLETLIRRPTVAIDGTRYELLSADELSVLDSHRFHHWGRDLERLQQEQPEGEDLQLLIDRVARQVLVDVPDEVFAKLTGAQRIAVVEVFFVLLLRSRMGVAGATTTIMGTGIGERPTGAKSSPGSSGSTADRPGSGWKARLSRWFGRI